MTNYYEEIKRRYPEFNTTIIYELINKDEVYLHSIIVEEFARKLGYGTKALKHFLEDFKYKNIYLLSSNELGTNKKVLDKWYNKLGFININSLNDIPYNVTHVKKRL